MAAPALALLGAAIQVFDSIHSFDYFSGQTLQIMAEATRGFTGVAASPLLLAAANYAVALKLQLTVVAGSRHPCEAEQRQERRRADTAGS